MRKSIQLDRSRGLSATSQTPSSPRVSRLRSTSRAGYRAVRSAIKCTRHHAARSSVSPAKTEIAGSSDKLTEFATLRRVDVYTEKVPSAVCGDRNPPWVPVSKHAPLRFERLVLLFRPMTRLPRSSSIAFSRQEFEPFEEPRRLVGLPVVLQPERTQILGQRRVRGSAEALNSNADSIVRVTSA